MKHDDIQMNVIRKECENIKLQISPASFILSLWRFSIRRLALWLLLCSREI